MRVRILVIAMALLLLCAGTGNVLAVGYESYNTAGCSQAKPKIYPQTERGLYDAIKQASFLEKCPLVIDEVAFAVKDILSQFGLAKSRNSR